MRSAFTLGSAPGRHPDRPTAATREDPAAQTAPTPRRAPGPCEAHNPSARWSRARARLVATDLDWACGDGERLEGRAIDLLMVACGRTALLPQVTGAGAAVLRERL